MCFCSKEGEILQISSRQRELWLSFLFFFFAFCLLPNLRDLTCLTNWNWSRDGRRTRERSWIREAERETEKRRREKWKGSVKRRREEKKWQKDDTKERERGRDGERGGEREGESGFPYSPLLCFACKAVARGPNVARELTFLWSLLLFSSIVSNNISIICSFTTDFTIDASFG